MSNVKEKYGQFLQDPRLKEKTGAVTDPYIPYTSSDGREFRLHMMPFDAIHSFDLLVTEATRKQGESDPTITNYIRIEAKTDKKGNVTGYKGLKLWRQIKDGTTWCMDYMIQPVISHISLLMVKDQFKEK